MHAKTCTDIFLVKQDTCNKKKIRFGNVQTSHEIRVIINSILLTQNKVISSKRMKLQEQQYSLEINKKNIVF